MAAEWFPLEEEAHEKFEASRRGEVYLVEFDPARETQSDIGNRYSPITIIAAITSKLSRVPHGRGNGLSVPSAINLGQIRSIDRERLVKRLGAADAATMLKVDDALKSV